MRVVLKQILNKLGPIILSVLSIFIAFIILQPIACSLDSSFNLLANRGIGKIAFTFLIIYQIFLLFFLLPKPFFTDFLKTNILFLKEKIWPKYFLKYFFAFLILHIFILILFMQTGFLTYNPNWGSFNLKTIFKISFGFIATFFLAWTEELIFRGTLFKYFIQYTNKLYSAIITSIIFMFAHNLYNPLKLVSSDWQLGLGLFLLGLLLNLIFIDTNKLYANMGAHGGLVFVKVFLRKSPILLFLPASQLPFWINKDLRCSILVHILFLIAILFYIYKTRKKLF